MSHINIPPFEPIPEGATLEWRQAALARWRRALQEANPGFYAADGRLLSWWERFLNTIRGA